LYDFTGLPQTLLLNPGAKVNNQFFFGLPMLSRSSLQAGFTGFSTYDIFADDGADINDKIKAALKNYGKTEFIAANQQLEILYAGFRLPNNRYLTVGYYQEIDVLAKIPKDLVDLFYEGNTVLNRKYSVKKLTARAEMLGVLHIGLSKKVNNKWQIGARAKLYSSVFNIKSTGSTGSIYTESGTNNILNQHLANVNFLVQTSGLILEDDIDFDTSYLKKNLLFGGSFGLGFDIGFTYQLKEQWELSASLLDIGFISNTKSNESYKVVGDFEIEGFQLFFDPDNPEDYWNDLEERFEEEVVTETIYDNYISFRPIKFNGALSYSFGQTYDDCRFLIDSDIFNNKVGFHLYSNISTAHTYLAASIFYERRFNAGFSSKITYTIDPYSFTNLGFGLSTQLGAFNMYILADNLLNLNNFYHAKSASMQMGFNFIFNKKK
jgi:hypothetical protein